jgi:hypothetical protein
MVRRALRPVAVAAAVLLLAVSAQAGVTRVAGPTTILGESRGFFKFDAAYDSQHRLYLAAWGTQLPGPVNGLLLNESGVPVSSVFPLSDGAQQSGWARVVYSAEQGKFLVTYVRIVGVQHHQKVARFVTVSNNTASLGAEKILDDWTGDSGTASGVTYARASGKFLVTWSHYFGALPNSFVTTIDASGNVSSTQTVSDPSDGESDPEIDCDPVNRKCLVIGGAWGIGTGAKSSFWARYVDDATGAPLGPNAVYVAVWGGLMDPPAVAYNAPAARFLMGIGMGGVIHGMIGNAADRSLGAPFPILRDSAGTAGIGYGFLSMRSNPTSGTVLASLTTWLGFAAVQEFDGTGAKVAGGFDLIPDTPERTGGNDRYSTANQYATVAPNTVTGGALLLENHFFKAIRATVYSGGTAGPPPPPPPGAVNISTLTPNGALTGLAGAGITWTAAAAGGSTALQYQFQLWRPGIGWRTVREYASASTATLVTVPGAQAVRVNVKQTSAPTVEATRDSATFVSGVSRALSLDAIGGADFFGYSAANGGGHVVSGTVGAMTEVNYGTGWGAGNIALSADFNGDGMSDLFLYNPTTGQAQRAINIGGNNFTYDNYAWAAGLTFVAGDFNGDGRDDLFAYSKTNGSWTKLLTDAANVFQMSFGTWSTDWEIYPADFNGDGLTDLFVYNKNAASPNAGRWVKVISGANGVFDGFYEGTVRVWSTTWSIIPGDYDGDGKTDLMLYGTDGRWFKVFFPTLAGPERYVSGQWSAGWTVGRGDFNGDGRDDVFVYNQLTGRWFEVLSTGDGWIYYENTVVWSGGWVPTVTDIDRDGLADLILYNPSSGRWFQVRNNGTAGQFDYYTGANFEAGLTIVANSSSK